jgi:hypothetical protein
MGSTAEYPNKYGIVLSNFRNRFLGGKVETTHYTHGSLSGYDGATMFKVTDGANQCEIDTFIVDGDPYDNTKLLEITGTVLGLRVDCMLDGNEFVNADERLITAATATIREIDATFHGNFTDALMSDNQGGSEAAGMKKLFDLPSGWSGSITVIDTASDAGAAAGAPITLQEGLAY